MRIEERIDGLIRERSRRRGLRISLETVRYLNRQIYKNVVPHSSGAHVLYVGIGHGHDALLALADNLATDIVGVDPYYSAHGNDESDYVMLTDVVSEFGLTDRLKIERRTIADFLHANGERFDHIVCNDVLHHLFETERPLAVSPLFSPAVELFRSLRDACTSQGRLIICDVARHGLRPWLGRFATKKVAYETKQSWRQWTRAATSAGWIHEHIDTYVPFSARALARCLSNRIGRFVFCDRYLLTFRSS
jgi:SAM-dependent methyltransferase